MGLSTEGKRMRSRTMQTFWIEDGQVFSVLDANKEGLLVMLNPGTQRRITWEEAKRLHAQNPENGLMSLGTVGDVGPHVWRGSPVRP